MLGKPFGLDVVDVPPPTRAVITPADLVWQGCCAVPKTISGQDTTLSWGLALRRINGQVRILMNPWHLFELALPTLGTNPASPPQATVTQIWPQPDPTKYSLPYPTPHNTSGGVSTYGLYWDEPSQLIWYVHGRDYNTNQPYLPTIGAAALGPNSITVKGIWGLNQRSCKMLQGGFLSIPSWFGLGDRRMACGFGGYFSVINTGPCSMGLALTAFNPDALLTKPNLDVSSPHTPLAGYSFIGTPYITDRGHRDTDVINDYDGWDPKNGIGYWTWNDTAWEAACWIDTPTKSGVLFAPTMGNGRGWYDNSMLHSDRGSHWWFCYDPTDLAKVAAGTVPSWAIQPSSSVSVQYPGTVYPLAGWQGGPPQRVAGIAWDAQASTVYLAVRRGQNIPILIHAYRVM